jgi:DNA-directed RNA polymerase specialized sigma24 family protein
VAVQIAEQFQQLLTKLADDDLCRIALDKLDNYTNEEIAERMDLSLRTVERRLNLIRRIWEEETSDD